MNFSCYGKSKIPNKELAKKIARRIPGRKWYKCDICKQYHVGRTIRRKLPDAKSNMRTLLKSFYEY
jgi:hypothetical protein